jgi:hypothetical protein
LEHAPLEAKLLQAAYRGDKRAFLEHLPHFLTSGGTSIEAQERALDHLRPYTYEIASMSIPSHEVPYGSVRQSRHRLILATLLGDTASLSTAFGSSYPHSFEDRALVGTYLHDFSVFNDLYARLAETCGIEPVKIRAAQIEELYDCFQTLPAPSKVASVGKVSVIMTVFNPDLDLLRLAVRSILRQSYEDLELLVVDDGSDKIPFEGIEGAIDKDPRTIVIRTDRNAGPYSGRNLALARATGDFIAIQDGDDYAHPRRLEKQLSVMTRDPRVQLCTSSHFRFDRLAHLQFEAHFAILGDGTMSSVFRRSVFDRIGGFLAVRSRGDVEFRERIKQAFGHWSTSHIECPLVFCYASPDTLSHRTARRLKDYLKLFRTQFGSRLRMPWSPENRQQYSEDGPVKTAIPWPLRP